MIFVALLTSFFIESFDVTVVICDADWLNRAKFEQVASAELSELPDEDRRGLILTVDQCTEASVRLRVSYQGGQRERFVPLEDVPAEARLRTIALTLGDLVREPEAAPQKDDADKNPVCEVPPREKTVASKPVDDVAKAPPANDPKRNDDQQPTKPDPEPVADDQRDLHVSIGLYARAFPLAKTLAPEARIGLRTRKWRLDLGSYVMGWNTYVGNAYLLAITITAGPTLWRHQGKVPMGLDALLEIGAITAFGKADYDADQTPKFNIAAGGHLSYWLGFGRMKRLRLVLDVGWLRGLNILVATTVQGGFEGPSAALGLTGAW